MEILSSILGNRGRPSKDNSAFLVAVFCMLANGVVGGLYPSNTANGEVFLQI